MLRFLQKAKPRFMVGLLSVSYLFLMVSCGGSAKPGGDSGSLKITSVKAPTSTSVEVGFSKALGEGANSAANFQLTAPGGAALQVVAAYPDAAGTTVTLATQPQDLVAYSLQAQNLKSKDGQAVPSVSAPDTFAGSSVAAPIVASAVPLSNTTVLVTFADPATAQAAAMGQSAADARFYRISNPDLKVEQAELQADGTSVVLTTAAQARATYTVEVTNVYSKAGKLLIDPFTNSASFSGIPPDDPDPPVITSVTATDNTTVLVSFSEPLKDGAADRNNYRVSDPSQLPLTVLGASLDSFKTTVTLKTAAQTQGEDYTLEVKNVTDLSGNQLSPGTLERFLGGSATGSGSDTVPPRVLGASSLNNKQVVVTFSEVMDKSSAEAKENYSIFGATDGQTLEPQAILLVTGAVLNSGGRSVTLTTLSQSNIQYNVQVNNVKDLAGNFIAPPDRENPYVANFRGIAPSGSDASDTDGDGLNDDVEQLGWTVTVKLANGTETKREVTSDPTDPDTDDDGLTDAVEKTLLLDPRNKDTDADELSDNDEYNVYFSEPTRQDTDADGLLDGLEITLFGTNPTEDDTDADGLLDGAEISINNPSPRAKLADLPRFDTVISSVDLQLDYRFNETVGNSTTSGETQSTALTTMQADTATTSRQNSSTQNWFTKAGTEVCLGGACSSENGVTGLFYNFGLKLTVEGGAGGETSFVTTQENARAIQEEYAKTLETTKTVTAEKTITREVVGATMKVSVTFKSQSNVSFILKNLEFTAQIRDPADPTRYLPIGKLVNPSLEVDLGPKGSSQGIKGPIIFEVENPVPSVVEKLMQNPSGIVVSLGNYRVEARGERNFVFDLEDIANRTAQFEIDYGGRRDMERLNPATYAGFDETGKPKGITLKQFMEEFLELEHIVATPSADGKRCTETTPESKLAKSYATCMITVGSSTTEALWRVRDVSRSENVAASSWWVLTPDNGLITPVPEAKVPWRGFDFGSYVIRSGQVFAIKFVKDADFDGLEATVEATLGTSDEKPDSDGDGINDGDEVYGLRGVDGKRLSWPIQLADGTVIKVSANPARKDGDGDGLDDCQELIFDDSCSTVRVFNGSDGPNLNAEGAEVAAFALPSRTDPSSPDTDKEGLTDALEVAGYKGKKYDDALNLIDYTLLPQNGQPAINPLDPTTDGDVLNDFMELLLGTDPTVDDGDKVLDDDGDGLVNLAEAIGWNVATYQVSTVPNAQGAGATLAVQSDPKKKDADGDGLSDKQEKEKGTNPAKNDSDGDGWPDDTDPYPLDADQDNDLLSDLEETQGCLTWGATEVDKADVDLDGLVDGVECKTYKTNPKSADTDGDGYRDDRDIALGLNPLSKDQLLDISLLTYNTLGDCELDTIFEDALSGAAEFEGLLKIQMPNGTVENLWNMVIKGPGFGDTHAGETVYLRPAYGYNPARRVILVDGGPAVKLFSSTITEVDARTCCDTSVLGELGPIEFKYQQPTKNYAERVGYPGCMIQVNYRTQEVK